MLEMEGYVQKLREGAQQQKQEERQISHKAIVKQLTAGVEGFVTVIHTVSMSTRWSHATLSA